MASGIQLYDVNLTIGADIHIGAAVVTPKIGVDNNHICTGSYTVNGTGKLWEKSDDVDSLRVMDGVGMKVTPFRLSVSDRERGARRSHCGADLPLRYCTGRQVRHQGREKEGRRPAKGSESS